MDGWILHFTKATSNFGVIQQDMKQMDFQEAGDEKTLEDDASEQCFTFASIFNDNNM